MDEYKLDEAGFRGIFETHFDPICRFLSMYTRNESVIEDIVQEVFCNLWTSRDFIRIKHVKSYLYTAARNRILNHLRNERLHASILADYMLDERGLQQAYQCVDREEFARRLDELVDDLPPKCRTVFKLSRYSQMSHKEIARREGISEKSVEKHITSALRKIRDRMRNMPLIVW